MKGNRLKTLGFALLGGLALLFAGCGQQTTTGGGTGTGGAVTSVGIQLPGTGTGSLSGVVQVGVNVNEGAQVKSVVLKVDGQAVNQITVQGLRPQALTYSITLDTAQLDPNTKQPKFLNGTHTLSVEVTDVNNNTKTASTQVVFTNNDYVRGLVVSQTDNPKAPVTASGVTWYGNGDVYVTADIVNYSGATYSITGPVSPFSLSASGGQGGTISSTITVTGAAATPVSGQPQLVFKKSNNSGVSTNSVSVQVGSSGPSVTFGLDNAAPTGTPTVEVRHPLLSYSFNPLSSFSGFSGTSETLFRGSGASDTGVDGLTYTVTFSALAGNVTVTLPGAPSAGQKVSGLVNGVTYSVSVVSVADALGNTATANPPVPAGSFQLANATVQISNVSVSNTQPNAGGSFNVSASASSPVSSVTPRVGLLLGSDLIDLGSVGSVPAYAGAQYVVYAVDAAGNFAVQPLPVTVQQPASDKTPPTIGLTLPSSAWNNTPFNLSGSVSDNVTPPSSVNLYASWAQGLGGYNWYNVGGSGTSGQDYANLSVSGGSYTGTNALTAPDYAGTLRVVVYGVDAAYNLGSNAGTLNVQ